jgi:hypothetical protein
MKLEQATAKRFARTDTPCKVCNTILKAGERRANQFLCCNEDSRDLTDCQKLHYAAKPKVKRIMCDVCKRSIIQQDPNQKRCVAEGDGDSECQKIAKARTAANHYTPVTKELPEAEETKPPGRKPKSKRTKRICMKCHRKFPSTGPYHRICDKCNTLNERVSRKEVKSISNGEINNYRRAGDMITEFVQPD